MDKYNNWLAKFLARLHRIDKYAITLGQTSYFSISKDQVSKSWHVHEDCHKRQWARDGVLKFITLYLWWSLTKGYTSNPYEAEAREAANEVT